MSTSVRAAAPTTDQDHSLEKVETNLIKENVQTTRPKSTMNNNENSQFNRFGFKIR